MNDEDLGPREPVEPSTDDPIERELSERLARGDDSPVRDADPAELRDASAWVEHLDALVTDVEHRATPAEGTAPDPISVRDTVLERLVHHPRAMHAAAPRRSPAPRRPWWQATAPFVVAGGLAALFFWQQRIGSGDPLPAPPSVVEAPGTLPKERVSTAPEVQEHVEETVQPVESAESDAAAGLQALEVAPLARSMAMAPTPTAHAEAESLLALLERGGADPLVTVRMRTRLIALRVAIADTSLAARIDRDLARHPPDPR